MDGPKSLLGHESDATIEYAEKRGYAAALFHSLPLPANLNSTRAEADYVGKYLKAQKIHKILLVTSNYHTHRAAYLFRKYEPRTGRDCRTGAGPEFNPDSWWTDREGQKTFVMEWMKTVAAYLGI